jgi:hypothetical protein
LISSPRVDPKRVTERLGVEVLYFFFPISPGFSSVKENKTKIFFFFFLFLFSSSCLYIYLTMSSAAIRRQLLRGIASTARVSAQRTAPVILRQAARTFTSTRCVFVGILKKKQLDNVEK